MYVHKISERDTKELVPGIIARTFWGKKMLTSIVELEPNAVLPDHSHPHEQQGMVLEGMITMTIDGTTYELTAEEYYVIPGGVIHSGTAGPDGCRVIDIFAPVREEYKY